MSRNQKVSINMGFTNKKFRGWDLRPHHRRVADDDEAGGGDGGIEILSVTRISIPGYDLALEDFAPEVDLEERG